MCLACKQISHGDVPCDTSATDAVVAMITKYGYKQCPKCGYAVERRSGCPRMICVCGAKWCYHCAKPPMKCDCAEDLTSESGDDSDKSEDLTSGSGDELDDQIMASLFDFGEELHDELAGEIRSRPSASGTESLTTTATSKLLPERLRQVTATRLKRANTPPSPKEASETESLTAVEEHEHSQRSRKRQRQSSTTTSDLNNITPSAEGQGRDKAVNKH
ncbi:hypothetical protein LTR50_003953 [Elasticomyces elasticus]|nr:hypothetical protein LTR50_003953 [Elasticomyces elasticus]